MSRETTGFPNRRARIAWAAALAVSVLAPLGPALADPPARMVVQRCLPHAEIAAKLQNDFKERKLGHGIAADGNLVEIFTAPAGGFTVLKTTPQGVACIVDFGESWQTLHQLEMTGFTTGDFGSGSTPF